MIFLNLLSLNSYILHSTHQFIFLFSTENFVLVWTLFSVYLIITRRHPSVNGDQWQITETWKIISPDLLRCILPRADKVSDEDSHLLSWLGLPDEKISFTDIMSFD